MPLKMHEIKSEILCPFDGPVDDYLIIWRTMEFVKSGQLSAEDGTELLYELLGKYKSPLIADFEC